MIRTQAVVYSMAEQYIVHNLAVSFFLALTRYTNYMCQQ